MATRKPGCRNTKCQTCQTARDVLTMAADGGTPDTFWQTDARILRAADYLMIEVDAAREWAQANCVSAGGSVRS